MMRFLFTPCFVLVLLFCSGCASSRKWDVQHHDVKDLGALQFDASIRGRTGGHSTLWNGQSFWVFADTKLSYKGLNRRGVIESSAAVIPLEQFGSGSLKMKEFLEGIEFLPLTTEESQFNQKNSNPDIPAAQQQRHVLRPGPVICSPDGANLYVLYSHTIRDGFNSPDPIQGGLSFAIFNSSRARPVRTDKLLFPYHDIRLDDAAMVHAGFLYLFGARYDESHGWGVRVGRVRFKDVLNRDEWQFWNGKSWNDSAKEAKPILTHIAPHFSIHWNAFLSRYLCVFANPDTREILITSADYITGPWSKPVSLQTFPADKVDSARAHRDLQQDNGRIEHIAVSYVRDGVPKIQILRLTFFSQK